MSDAKTEISLNGLRYKSKKSGSPYEGMRTGDTMSCMKCGCAQAPFLGLIQTIAWECCFFLW